MGKKEYTLAVRIAGEINKSLPDAMKYTSREMKKIARDAAAASQIVGKDFNRSLANTRSGLAGVNRFGSVAFRDMVQTAKIAGTAVGAVGAASVKVGMDFESQMSTVKAISGASADEFEALTAKAEYMGATTAFTAKQSGEAMEYMAMAGWKTKDMLDGVEGVMDLAAASGEDLGTTSDIVTDALTAFKMGAKDSTHFADVLATASASANTNVSMMGESFKYVAPVAGALEYSIEDVSQVLGLMANNSIKASQAGTSLRAWITRMSKPTKESEMAMKRLGISLEDSKGKTKDLSQVVQETRKAFAGLSKTDKSKYAAMLAGRTGMAGLLAVVNSTEKEYKELETAIKNADGAAKDMANTRLDNLKGDVTLFTSAIQGAGINIYDELQAPLRDLVQQGTEWVGDFSDGFATEFPTIVRETEAVAEAIGDFAEPFLDVGGWMLDNPDVIVGTIAGIGSALVTYKVASGVMSLAQSFMALSPATLGVLGAGAVIGGIVGIGTAMEVSAKKAAEANLDEHFGNVSLTMKELDIAARQIVGNGYLTQVEEMMDSEGKAAGFVDDMKGAMSDIQKTNWKIEAGFTLKESEIKDYESACRAYVEKAQDYISQQGYTVSIAVKSLFDGADDGGIIDRSTNWYKQLEERAEKLGNDLNNVLNKKLSKSFTIKNKKKKVSKILSDLDDITKQVADAQDKAKLDLLDAKWAGTDMDADSFQNLQKDINKYTEEATEGAESAYNSTMTSLEGQLASGKYTDNKGKEHKYTQEMYDADKQKALQAYYSKRSEAVMNGYDFMMGKVREKYGADNIDQAIAAVKSALNERKNEIAEYDQKGWDKTHLLNEIAQEALGKVKIDDTSKSAIAELMNQIVPTTAKIEEIKQQTSTTGIPLDKKIEDSMNKAVYDTKMLNAATGKVSYGDWAKDLTLGGIESFQEQITNMEDWDEAAKIAGKDTSKSYAEGIGQNMRLIQDAAENIKIALQNGLSSGITANIPINLTGTYVFSGETLSGFTIAQGDKQDNKKEVKVAAHASGGIFTTPHVGMVAEAGYAESIIPIDGSQHAYDLYRQTGQLLGVKDNPNSIANLAKRVEAVSQKNNASAGIAAQPIQINYSPKIIIQGNAKEEDITKATKVGYTEFEQMMKKYIKQNKRVSFKGG